MHSAHSDSGGHPDIFIFFQTPRTYEKIHEEQRKILSSYYDKGMTTTGNNMQKTIEEAAAKTNLSIDRVKVMFACVFNI